MSLWICVRFVPFPVTLSDPNVDFKGTPLFYGHSRSLKMTAFDNHKYGFVSAWRCKCSSFVPFSRYLTSKTVVSLKSILWVTVGLLSLQICGRSVRRCILQTRDHLSAVDSLWVFLHSLLHHVSKSEWVSEWVSSFLTAHQHKKAIWCHSRFIRWIRYKTN